MPLVSVVCDRMCGVACPAWAVPPCAVGARCARRARRPRRRRRRRRSLEERAWAVARRAREDGKRERAVTLPCHRPEPADAYADRPIGKRLRWCEDAYSSTRVLE